MQYMMTLYTDLIIDLSKNPLNRRPMPDANAAASGANVTCGDRFRISIKLTENGIMEDLSFQGEGCAISMAAASVVTEEGKGKNISEAMAWKAENIFGWLGAELGPSRVKCGMLPLEILQKALARRTIRTRAKFSAS
ncbi:iron-sulfur cluster assembly scaffold protein [Candidatus Peregrinibacteria bacterium]|nr:iron-sulfur cluster assembly scaffold protein [Candidatus Peregrinibacteria bacterium]